MLGLKDLSKVYRTETVETTALHNVNISIEKGEFVAIMGPSGCGKSTLLNIIGMLDTPTSGHYFFQKQDIAGFSENQLCNIRKQHIGFIFQSFNLIDELNVEENVELALRYHNIPAKERKERVQHALEKMAISHRAKHMPNQLSGGQQQRVAVARAVVGNQSFILADEPTGNLDSANGQEVMDLLQGLNEHGTTIVMVTHSANHADYANRTIHLLDGKIMSENINHAFNGAEPETASP